MSNLGFKNNNIITFAQQGSSSQYFFCVVRVTNDIHKLTPSHGQAHPQAPFASPAGINPFSTQGGCQKCK